MDSLARVITISFLFAIFYWTVAPLPVFAVGEAFLGHFDYGYDDTSGNRVPVYGGVRKSDGTLYGLPAVSTNTVDGSGYQKFGRGAAWFGRPNNQGLSADDALGYKLNNLPPLGTQDFVVDFWMYRVGTIPEGVYGVIHQTNDPSSRENQYILSNKLSSSACTWCIDTHPLRFLLYKGGSVVVDISGYIKRDRWSGNTLFEGPQAYPGWVHVVVVRQGGYFGFGASGKVFWRQISPSLSLSWPELFAFGGPTGSLIRYPFEMDELRVSTGTPPFPTDFGTKIGTPVSGLTYSYYTIPTTPTVGSDDVFAPGTIPSSVVPATSAPAPVVELFGTATGTTLTATTQKFFRADGTLMYEYDYSGTPDDQKPVATRYYASGGVTKTGELTYTDGILDRETYYAPDGSTLVESRIFYPSGRPYKEIIRRNGIERYIRYAEDGSVVYTHVSDFSSYDGARTYKYDASGNVTEDLIYYANNRYEKKLYSYSNGTLTRMETFTRVPDKIDGVDYFYVQTDFTDGKPTFERKTSADSRNMGRAKSVEDTMFSVSGILTRRESFDFANDQMSLATFKTDGQKIQTSTWKMSDGGYVSKTMYTYGADGRLSKENTIQFSNGLTIQPYTAYTIIEYTSDGAKKASYTYTFYSESLRVKDVDAYSYNPSTGEVLKRNVVVFADSATLSISSSKVYSKDGVLLGESLNFSGMKPGMDRFYYSDGSVSGESTYTYENATDYVRNQYLIYGGTRILSKSVRYRMSGTAGYPQASDTKVSTLSEDKLANEKIGEAILSILGISPSSVTAANEKDALYQLTRGVLTKYRQRLAAIGSASGTKYLRYAAYGDAAWDFQRATHAVGYRAWAQARGFNSDGQLDLEAGTSWVGTDVGSGAEFWGMYLKPGGAQFGSADVAYIDMTDTSAVDTALAQSSYAGLASLTKKREKWDSFKAGDTYIFNSAEGGRLYYWNSLANGGNGAYLSITERVKEDPSVNLLLDRMIDDFTKEGVNLKTIDSRTILTKTYGYLYKRKIIQYLYDAGDANQLPSETLARGGGDCDDNATLTLALFYNLLMRLERFDDAGRLGLVLGNADASSQVSTSNKGVGHAAVAYLDTNGTYYVADGAPLYMGVAETRPLTEPQFMPALSTGSVKSAYISAAEWYFAADAFSSVRGGTTFFTSAAGYSYTQKSLPGTAVKNDSSKFGTLIRYVEPANWRVGVIAKNFIEFIPRRTEKSLNDLVELSHDYFRNLVSYRADSGDDWNLVATTLGSAITEGVITGTITGDGEDLAFVEASVLTRIVYDWYVARGMFAPLALEKAKAHVILVGEKGAGEVVSLLVGFVMPTEDAQFSRVRLINPRSDTIGQVIFYSDLFDRAKYAFITTAEGATAIGYPMWSSLVLQ